MPNSASVAGSGTNICGVHTVGGQPPVCRVMFFGRVAVLFAVVGST